MTYLELTVLQAGELRELTRVASGRVALRALMVLWRAEGLSQSEIAQRLACHRDTVSLWLERYRTLGLAGLEDEARSGRPPTFDPDTQAQLETVVDHPPPETAGPTACWTLAHLRTLFLPVTARPFCTETLRRTLHALGFRWKRPRWWAHSEDPEYFEKQFLVELARERTREQATQAREPHPSPVHFFYLDASDHKLLAVIRNMWMRVGQQLRINTPPQNGGWTVFGALEAIRGTFHWQATEKAETTTFIAFLTHLLACYPDAVLLIALDNAKYHKSKELVAWLKQQPRLLLLYLPKRAPELNPIELLWRPLKAAVSANRSFAGELPLGQYIHDHFARLTPTDLLRQAGLRRDFLETT